MRRTPRGSGQLGVGDWTLSLGIHAALLGSVVWGLWQTHRNEPAPERLNLSVGWMSQAQAAAPVQPEPAPREPRRRARAESEASSLLSTPDVALAAAPTAPNAAPNEPLAAPAPADAGSRDSTPASAASAAPDAHLRWQGQLEAMLLKHKQYPLIGRRMRQEGQVTVLATFSAHGELLHCVVLSSSGFKALDEAAVQLVRHAAEAVRALQQPGRSAELRIPVSYTLRES